MGRNKRVLWIIGLFWLGTSVLSAQNHRFMVFFGDKGNDFSIAQPEEFLGAKAIERRSKQNIDITEQDLPVNPAYLTTLSNNSAGVIYSSKWFNAALVETDSSNLNNLLGLSFVTSIEFVAPGPLIPQIGRSRSKKQKSRNQNTSRTQSTDFQNNILGIDDMHSRGFTGAGMTIAVFDGGFSGVNNTTPFQHLFDNDQIISSYDFVGNGADVYRYDDHGTRALSVIGALEAGSFTGGVPDADFMLFVTEDVSSEYRIEEYNWAAAAEYADSAGVDIINTSLGYNTFDDPSMDYVQADMDGQTTVISQAAAIAATKGMVIITSAGNSGNSLWGTITAPADAAGTMAIGAITADSAKASFSSPGPTADGRIKPDVSALGVATAVINSSGSLVFSNGTSFSSPQIASLAAGYWQSNPDLSSAEVIAALKNSGSLAQSPDNNLGFGIPNFTRASDLVLSTDDPELGKLIQLFPNPIDHLLFLKTSVPLSQVTLTIHSVTGKKMLEQSIGRVAPTERLNIVLPDLTSGAYLVGIQSDQYSGSYRLIKR